MPLSFSLTPADKTFLGHQARTAIEAGLAGVYSSTPPAPPQGLPDDVLTRSLGAFVTLTINHGLRARSPLRHCLAHGRRSGVSGSALSTPHRPGMAPNPPGNLCSG